MKDIIQGGEPGKIGPVQRQWRTHFVKLNLFEIGILSK